MLSEGLASLLLRFALLCLFSQRICAQSASPSPSPATPVSPGASPGSTFPPCPAGQEDSCDSYGVDFQTGGTYFQNIASSDNFTFVSQFVGCQADVALNFFVNDTNGDGTEFQCSNTPMTPDDTNQLSTCPVTKNDLTTGNWSVFIISNNGNCDPIAYERDFSLTVGTQATVTSTPTVTFSSTTTPVITVTSTTSTVTTSTGSALFTVWEPSIFFKPTVTTTPTKIVYTTKPVVTLTVVKWNLTVSPQWATQTASCTTHARQLNPDPTATWIPSLVPSGIISRKFRRVPVDPEERKKERKARYARRRLQKRDIDQATVTVTDTNSSDFITSTVTVTATPPLTVTSTTTVTKTSTTRPIVTTKFIGVTSKAVTVTASTTTITKTISGVVTVSQTTKTITQKPTMWTTTAPPAVWSSCASEGGWMPAPPASSSPQSICIQSTSPQNTSTSSQGDWWWR